MKERIKSCLTENPDVTDYSQLSADLDFTPYQGIRGIASMVLRARLLNLKQVLREDARRFVLFPIAVPIILWLELLFKLGCITAYLQPDWLLKRYYQAESNPSEFASSSIAESELSRTK